MKNPETKKSVLILLDGLQFVPDGLFITGIALRIFLPGTIADTRLLEGFGILFTGLGIIPLSRSSICPPQSGRRPPQSSGRK